MNNEIDMGNMMSKTLVQRGKEVASKLYPNNDYGDLPSGTLTELGKEVLSSDNN